MKKPSRIKKYNYISDYLPCIYSTTRFTKLVDRLSKRIQTFQKKHNIEAIAFTGVSGAAVAYPLSYKLKIPLICIRKSKSHFNGKYEGRCDVKNYIIVDDFTETGATITRIRREVKRISRESNLIGIFLYATGKRSCYIDYEGFRVVNVS